MTTMEDSLIMDTPALEHRGSIEVRPVENYMFWILFDNPALIYVAHTINQNIVRDAWSSSSTILEV